MDQKGLREFEEPSVIKAHYSDHQTQRQINKNEPRGGGAWIGYRPLEILRIKALIKTARYTVQYMNHLQSFT